MLKLGVGEMSKQSSETKQPLIHGGKSDDAHIHLDIESSAKKSDFKFSHGLTSSEAQRLLQIHGKNELPTKVIPKWFITFIIFFKYLKFILIINIFNKYFIQNRYIFAQLLWQPMPIMIWIAALIEVAISNYLDMGILLMIQFANASIAFYEVKFNFLQKEDIL